MRHIYVQTIWIHEYLTFCVINIGQINLYSLWIYRYSPPQIILHGVGQAILLLISFVFVLCLFVGSSLFLNKWWWCGTGNSLVIHQLKSKKAKSSHGWSSLPSLISYFIAMIIFAIIFLIIGLMVRMFVQLITIIVTTSSGDVLSEWTKCPPLTLCLH